jgi:chromosome segregation ATPase
MTLEEMMNKSKEYKARMESLEEILHFLTKEYEEARTNYDEIEYEIYVAKNEEKY